MVGESCVAVAAATALASAYSFEYADLDADLLLKANFGEGGAGHSPVGYRHLDDRAGWPIGELSPESTSLLASC